MKKFFVLLAVLVATSAVVVGSAQASNISKREALQAAKSYLRSGHFSRAALIQQLQSPYGEHFTHPQAVYGVSVAYR